MTFETIDADDRDMRAAMFASSNNQTEAEKTKRTLIKTLGGGTTAAVLGGLGLLAIGPVCDQVQKTDTHWSEHLPEIHHVRPMSPRDEFPSRLTGLGQNMATVEILDSKYAIATDAYQRLEEYLDENDGIINSDLRAEYRIHQFLINNRTSRPGEVTIPMYANIYEVMNTNKQRVQIGDHCLESSQEITTEEIDNFIEAYEALRTAVTARRDAGSEISIGDILRLDVLEGTTGEGSALYQFVNGYNAAKAPPGTGNLEAAVELVRQIEQKYNESYEESTQTQPSSE